MFSLPQITVLSAIVCISCITAAPVDVNNDTRPIVGVIRPEEEKVLCDFCFVDWNIIGRTTKLISKFEFSHSQ